MKEEIGFVTGMGEAKVLRISLLEYSYFTCINETKKKKTEFLLEQHIT
jgi:hypothetical protein